MKDEEDIKIITLRAVAKEAIVQVREMISHEQVLITRLERLIEVLEQ